MLKFFKHYLFLIICFSQQRQLSEIVAIPGHTHLFFALAYLVNVIGGLCNASVARLHVSLIPVQQSLRLQAR